MILLGIIKLKYYFQFLTLNQKESFRFILIPMKTNLQLSNSRN